MTEHDLAIKKIQEARKVVGEIRFFDARLKLNVETQIELVESHIDQMLKVAKVAAYDHREIEI